MVVAVLKDPTLDFFSPVLGDVSHLCHTIPQAGVDIEEVKRKNCCECLLHLIHGHYVHNIHPHLHFYSMVRGQLYCGGRVLAIVRWIAELLGSSDLMSDVAGK